jgi:hypothetical protein
MTQQVHRDAFENPTNRWKNYNKPQKFNWHFVLKYNRLQKNRVHHKNQEHWIFLFLTHVNQAFLSFNGMLFEIGCLTGMSFMSDVRNEKF